MPSAKSDPLDLVFMALGDATRRQMVHMLAKGEMRVTELAEPFAMSLNAVSKHIKVLENANLVKRRVEGRVHYLTLIPEQLTGALDWISIYRYFWQRRFDQLENKLLEEEKH